MPDSLSLAGPDNLALAESLELSPVDGLPRWLGGRLARFFLRLVSMEENDAARLARMVTPTAGYFRRDRHVHPEVDPTTYRLAFTGVARDHTLDLPALLDAITDGLQDDPQALSRAVDGLIERFGHVVEAFDGQSGPLRQLKRLSVLGKRLINLYRAAPYLSPRREERLLPLVDGRDAPDRAAHFELVRQWRDRLERHRPRSKPDRAVMGDATALATLQLVNERARPLRQRLVLITGSENVFAAASEAEVLDGGAVTSFDRAYLRHPQAFIGAKDFFERRSPQAEAEHDKHHARLRIVDWLNLFFPKVLLQTRPSEGPAVAAAGMRHPVSTPGRFEHGLKRTVEGGIAAPW